jgi:glycerophosphoryl diester phosphodiesterase
MMNTRWILVLIVLLSVKEVHAADVEWVLLRTDVGDIEVMLDAKRAPVTVANFLRYIDAGHYNGGPFHRTVRADNQPMNKVKIAVIQAGVKKEAKEFPPIKLERTNATGLRHVHGAISMARDGPDTATGDFFLCVGDQPELDFAGKRNPDGQGFAAFGRVVRGMDVVRKINGAEAKEQTLTPPVGIRSAERLAAPPRLVGHRGLLRQAPENTLAAFAACIELNLGFELDVRRAKDGELVIVHDADLKRTTNGVGRVSDFTKAELKKLDAGSWFDAAFAEERIPTLEEVFTLVKSRGKKTFLALDLKDANVEQDTVRLAKKHGVVDQVVCIGTTIESAEVRRRIRGAATAVLAQTGADFPKALTDKEASWVYARFVPTAVQVKQAQAVGKKVFVVGTSVMGREPENWIKAREAGVDAILTDYPLECRRVLRGEKP